MVKNGFFTLSVDQILDGYKNRTLSPTDVAQICIDQVEKLESTLHAWVIFDSEGLLNQAQEINNRIGQGYPIRQLDGIPIGIKDIFNTVNFPTEMGSPIWKDFTPGNDARCIYYLKKEGALIPGKTVTAEFAVHTLGKTVNPHDYLRTPGTSSSGSAVAVATGMIPVAIGTQTAGSIIRPASFCGIYGFKPSFGLIPRTGVLKTTDSLDTIGFFCLHYSDIKKMFEIMRVHGPNYPLSHAALTDIVRQEKPPNSPWRVAFVKTHVWDEADHYAQSSLINWSEKLLEFKEIDAKWVNLPSGLEKTHRIHSTIYNKALAYYFKEEYKNKTLVSPIMKDLIAQGNNITSVEYNCALKQQNTLIMKMDEFFKDYDIIISLSTAGEAPLRDIPEKKDPGLIWTLTHLPVISAPIFKSPKGLPFGAQVVSQRYNDLKLLTFCDYLKENSTIPQSSFPNLKKMD